MFKFFAIIVLSVELCHSSPIGASSYSSYQLSSGFKPIIQNNHFNDEHSHHQHHHQLDEHFPTHHPKYDFKYGVSDPHTKDFKEQHEERDGDNLKGVYAVMQPDGMKRSVYYSYDQEHGFNADVKYTKML